MRELLGAIVLFVLLAASAALSAAPPGANPNPIALLRPPIVHPSLMAKLGRDVFYDVRLSSSGRMSCASCHSAAHAYASPTRGAVMLGGPKLQRQGIRAVPSLMYLERQPNFSIGPDNQESENVNLPAAAARGMKAPRTKKTALSTAQSAANVVPQGGLFWDGRADTLEGQALFPLLNPLEMDGGSVARVAAKLRSAPYARDFVTLFGRSILHQSNMLVTEALFAVARYEYEDASFHPYTSKYDYWLEGKAELSPAELRGYRLFNDPKRGDCAACHLDQPTKDRLPPLFTDHQFEAIGVPRNRRLAADRDPHFYDLGICGPIRSDMRSQKQFCAMFITPTLRNVATRHAFFHNGVYHDLKEVLDFYNFRTTRPQRIYPRRTDGSVDLFDDIPPKYRGNVDVVDPPFNLKSSDEPPLTRAQEDDIAAFLSTLTDGYRPRERSATLPP